MRDAAPRIIKMGDALSQLINVSWPFWDHTATSANESISGRCYRESRWFRRVVNALWFWQRNPKHCERAYLSDLQRARDYVEAHEARVANQPKGVL